MDVWDWGLQHLHPSLELSIFSALALGLAALALRRFRPGAGAARSFAREFAVVMALQALWQYVGREVRTRSAGAMERAQEIDRLERTLHLPSELSLQHAVLTHEWLAQAMNVYYATVHLDGTFVFLFWVWWRRRERFRAVRNTLVVTTLTCLLLQMIPVAPPRLLPGAGFVDTGLRFGQSVYGPYTTGLATQLTAMPSLHIGWAFIVAWYLTELGRGPWKALGWVHLAVTFVVITATANHWWLDGVAAMAVVLVVLALQRLLARQDPGGDVDRAGPVTPEERRPAEAQGR
jgi:PAP2 superfamily protein